MNRRLLIPGCAGLAAAALWLGRQIDGQTPELRAAGRELTRGWIPIHLKNGRTLWLDLHDDEMLENVQPEPFPDGRAGSVARWTRQLRATPKQELTGWPEWLAPYPGAEQAEQKPYPWGVVSGTERRGGISRSYRTADPPDRVIGFYRSELARAGIAVTGQTREPPGVTGLHGESGDRNRTVDVTMSVGGYSVFYRVIESGRFTPPPAEPMLDLSLASVEETGQFVRLRNRVDGEILRRPFSCLATDSDRDALLNPVAAQPPDFLPPYPGAKEPLPPEDDPKMFNLAFQVKGEPPDRVAAFYKQRVMGAGFKIESASSGSDKGRPYSGFQAAASDGRRVMFSAFQTEGETAVTGDVFQASLSFHEPFGERAFRRFTVRNLRKSPTDGEPGEGSTI